MHDYSQWRQSGSGKTRECYQRGIDVDNLAEELYQSLMSGYQITRGPQGKAPRQTR